MNDITDVSAYIDFTKDIKKLIMLYKALSECRTCITTDVFRHYGIYFSSLIED